MARAGSNGYPGVSFKFDDSEEGKIVVSIGYNLPEMEDDNKLPADENPEVELEVSSEEEPVSEEEVEESEEEVEIEDEVEVEVEPQKIVKNVPADFEAFEYFVDFDEPEGEALTDDDLYN